MTSSIIQLECQCNNYPWGKKGKHSLAARFAAATPGGNFELDESKEYAEQWMGTYPTTPSLILSTGEDLQEHLDAFKEALIGKPILSRFGTDLPFLPKILSIAKALPLQIHPDKELAQNLHAKAPDKYGDANHKPEIAVALSKFEVFVGWKPLPRIQALFTTVPVLRKSFLPNSGRANLSNDDLKAIVTKMLSASDEEVQDVYEMLRKINKEDFGAGEEYISELLPRLAEQYGKTDPGTIVALLVMNFMVLEKGEAIYVPADGIHAYLSGDIVECMARSDNVLNTGFCPRADRDSIELFTTALTFSPKSADEALLKPKPSEKGRNGHTQVLAPPLSEFDMLVTVLKSGEKETIEALKGPAIMIVTGGKGTLIAEGKETEVKEGFVFFIGYDTEVELEAGSGLETHIAFSEG
ncbi:probable mannose-6-phosphate isomerase [Rhynchosporium secalis]|uniref:Mannose-6-phosphate isomerase n=1 Tax=Rhynchosporium secalis TaxID=38038 RepID=A0A1E1LXB1_RHYSE|nr:probable mannose-6-phosphate isomerase [Rhynchosporium secalis]